MKILLTATVTPQVTWDLYIQEPSVRRRQYVESLRQWVAEAGQHGAELIFMENSGEDLDALARAALQSVPSFLHLVNAPPPTPQEVERGKGAAEAAMMDLFCDRFLTFPDEACYKVTGRLFVRNFSACIPVSIPDKSFIARVALNFAQMDTRFFGATAELWASHLTGAGVHVRDRDKMFLEKVLMRRVLTAMGEGAQLLRFAAQPAWVGRSGTHADRVYDSLANRFKRTLTNPLESALKGPLRGKQF